MNFNNISQLGDIHLSNTNSKIIELIDSNGNIENPEVFKQYYLELQKKKQQENEQELSKIKSRQEIQDEALKEYNNLRQILGIQKNRRNRIVEHFVTIDTRDVRQIDKLKYPKPNYFKYFLGKEFNNVKNVELIKVEFPNTNAVINKNNNKIYWRNLEDINLDIIDTTTNNYPVYSVSLRIGSYNISSLQSEIQSKMNLVKRKNGEPGSDYHSMNVSLDFDTDIVKFTSLTLQYLANNPFTSTLNSGVVIVNASNHSFSNGEIVYISGATGFAGLSTSDLNSQFAITYIDTNTFSIELNVNATETTTGGGNTVQVGKEAPFQFLYGEYNINVAQNIGYPRENSSLRIDTEISSIKNVNLIELKTFQNHNMTLKYNNTIDSFIGSFVDLDLTNTVPNISKYNNITISSPDDHFILPAQTGLNLSQILLPNTASIVNNNYYYIRITTGLNSGITRKIYNYSGSSKLITLFIPLVYPLNENDELDVYFYPSYSGYYNEIAYLPNSDSICIIGYNMNTSIPEETYTLPNQTGMDLYSIKLPVTASFINNYYYGWYLRIVETGEIKKIINYDILTNILIIDPKTPLEKNVLLGFTILLYKYPTQLSLSIENNGDLSESPYFSFNNNGNMTIYNVSTIKNYDFSFVKVETNINHNLSEIDVNNLINITDTDSIPTYDGNRNVASILNDKNFLLSGTVFTGGEGTTGKIPRNNPLKTYTYAIQNVIIYPTYAIFQTNENTILQIGDNIKFYNITSIPNSLNNNIYRIQSIPSSNTFIINGEFKSINILENTYIGTGIIKVSLPNHNFNNIISLENDDPGEVIIQTLLPHNLNTGDNIRISNTNCIPNIDDFYGIRYISDDTFSINFYTQQPRFGELPSQLGVLSNEVKLPSTISSVSENFIKILSTDEYHFISNFNNTTKILTIEQNWTTQPLINDQFMLYTVDTAFTESLPVQSGVAINQMKINSSNANLVSIGDFVKITSGSETGSIKKIISFNSLTYIITFDSNFNSNPTVGDTFLLYNAPLNTNGTSGIIGASNKFYLYGSNNIGGISSDLINGKNVYDQNNPNELNPHTTFHTIRSIIDADNFTFTVATAFSTISENGGGNNVFISSLKHGFSGIQDNTKNDLLNRSINLEGENYVFICCPQLKNLINSGNNVDNIFARITLDESPGNIVFSSVNNTISPPIVFTNPLSKLNELEFSVRNYDNTLYDFNDLDWSMVLKISEEIYDSDTFNVSSRSGV
jgi:hypothetical protein